MITTPEELRRLNIWIAERKREMQSRRVLAIDGKWHPRNARLQRLVAQAQCYADRFTEILKARGSL